MRIQAFAFLAPLAGFVLLSGPVVPPAHAAPGSARADRKAGKELRAAWKKLAREKSFTVTLTVRGGLSEAKDHSISEHTIFRFYEGSVYGNSIMHVPAHKAFRTTRSGTKFVDGIWKRITSDGKGKQLHRLFKFPAEALADACRFARRARWLEKDTPQRSSVFVKGYEVTLEPRAEGGFLAKAATLPGCVAIGETREDSVRNITREIGVYIAHLRSRGEPVPKTDKEREGEPPAGPAGGRSTPDRGRTVPASGTEKAPRWVGVEVPTKEALRHFLKVESSGCFGGG